MTVAVESPDQAAAESVAATLQLYFDGLYGSDTERLARAFHPQAIYASATGGVISERLKTLTISTLAGTSLSDGYAFCPSTSVSLGLTGITR